MAETGPDVLERLPSRRQVVTGRVSVEHACASGQIGASGKVRLKINFEILPFVTGE
jgi:hypothetical protein